MFQTVGEMLAASAARWPSRAALIEGERRLTYAELDALAHRIAGAMRRRGLGRGACVAFLSASRLEYPALFYGAARAGALQAHLSIRATADDLVHAMTTAATRALFVHVEQLEAARAARRRLPGLELVVVFGGAAALERDEIGWEDFLASADGAPVADALGPDEPFCVTFTGGTTGKAKGVLVSQRARLANAENAIGPFGLSASDVCVLCTPMFHVAGLFSWQMPAIRAGATLVLLPHWGLAEFCAAVARHGATQALCVPTQIAQLVGDPHWNAADLATLRLFNYGGSPMPEAIVARARERLPQARMLEHYGQSEAGAVAYRPPERSADKPLSIGVMLPHYRLAIRDPAGRDCAAGELGELLLKGESLFLGYLGDAEATRAAFTADGWLKTGDVGYRDAEGFVFLVDRAKDMIISGGENLYPAEIENALAAHPAVRECAVFGIPDEQWGEVPAAHVVLMPGAAPAEAELIEHVGARIARHKRPRRIVFVDALPKTAIGKVQKNLIRAPYWRGRERQI